MSIIKIKGKDAKPVLVFVLGLLIIPVFAVLSRFSSVFIYLSFAGMALAAVGLIWAVLRRRHDVA